MLGHASVPGAVEDPEPSMEAARRNAGDDAGTLLMGMLTSTLRKELKQLVQETLVAELKVTCERLQQACCDELRNSSERIHRDLKKGLQELQHPPHRVASKEPGEHRRHIPIKKFEAPQLLDMSKPKGVFESDLKSQRRRSPVSDTHLADSTDEECDEKTVAVVNSAARAAAIAAGAGARPYTPQDNPPLLQLRGQPPQLAEPETIQGTAWAAPAGVARQAVPALRSQPATPQGSRKVVPTGRPWVESQADEAAGCLRTLADLRNTASSKAVSSLAASETKDLSSVESLDSADTESDCGRPKLQRFLTKGESMYKQGMRQRLSLRLELARKEGQDGVKSLTFGNFVQKCWRMSCEDILNNPHFDNMISLFIVINAVTIGVEADYAARELTDNSPLAFRVIEVTFGAIFTSELLLRIRVQKCAFLFKMETSVLWNYFDLFVVSAQVLQEFFLFLVSNATMDVSQLRVLRVLRVLRIVRIFRLVRVLHLISELRRIVSSILGSFKSLGWTVVLLILMMYIVGVLFTQTITDHMVDRKEEAYITAYNASAASPEAGTAPVWTDGEQWLRYYFGDLSRTMFSLWEAISGGADWDSMANPLWEIQPIYGLAFAAYIAFAILALMNVVTGVFVQTALQSANKEEDNFVREQIVALFNRTNRDKQAKISKEEILCKLNDPANAKEWKALDITAEEAKHLFELLDSENDGEVFFEEFLCACLRLHGPAKALDMLTCLQEARGFRHELYNKLDHMEEMITIMAGPFGMEEMVSGSQQDHHPRRNSLKQNPRAVQSIRQAIHFLDSLVESPTDAGSPGRKSFPPVSIKEEEEV